MNLDCALRTFVAECGELLQEMEDALLGIEHTPGDDDTLNAIFRAAHTIKGSAGLFGLDDLVAFTHAAESVLAQVRAGALVLDAPLAELMLAACDHIGTLVRDIASASQTEPAVHAAGAALVARLNACLGQPEQPAAAQPAPDSGAAAVGGQWRLALRFGPDVFRNGMDPLAFIRYLGKLGRIDAFTTVTDQLPSLDELDPETCYLGYEISLCSDAAQAEIEAVFEFVREDSQISVLRVAADCPAAPEQPQRAKEGKVGEAKGGETNLIRVDADKLDQLINLVGELIIAGAGVQLIARANKDAGLLEATSTLSRLVEEVRDSALTLRMVEIGATFKRFQRVVHDVSRELGKEIGLEISGADTELDKTVVEKIGDPLMHLVRNAIDHGIEAPAERLARGKPARGELRLNAFHDAGCVVIEVSDDGRGLCRESILRKARQRGLVAEGQVMSDQEICQLIFEPGFSTAEQVSNLSGRGVGMDVVRKNIMALRGSVELTSVEGEGATVRIRLPLTLAIIDGFQVKVGDAAFVIPLDLVVECIELSQEDRRAANERNYIALRGQVLPYLNLRELFEVAGERTRRENLVVVQYGEVRIGLVVDVLLGEMQAVIKPLGRMFSQINGIGGSTILGNGAVGLILDVPALVRQVTINEERMLADDRQQPSQASAH